MKKFLRFLRISLLTLLGLIALAAALFGYFIYSPDPVPPTLSGTRNKGTIEVGGLKRTYVTYIPHGLP